jgi:hypothetical protein
MRQSRPRKTLKDRPVIEPTAERAVLAREAVRRARLSRPLSLAAVERLFLRAGLPAEGFASSATIRIAHVTLARSADGRSEQSQALGASPVLSADAPFTDAPLNGWQLFGDAVARGWTLH